MDMTVQVTKRRLSVLVVDDDQSTSRLIKRNLEDANIQIIEAATGLGGIEALGKTKVDIVLLDVRLPDFSGWGILSLLRLTEPLSRIPVVMCSVDPPDPALTARFKPDDYIQKPFDMTDLLHRVKRFLGYRD